MGFSENSPSEKPFQNWLNHAVSATHTQPLLLMFIAVILKETTAHGFPGA